MKAYLNSDWPHAWEPHVARGPVLGSAGPNAGRRPGLSEGELSALQNTGLLMLAWSWQSGAGTRIPFMDTCKAPAVCRSSRGNSLELNIWFSSSSTFSYSWGSPTHMESRRIRSGTVMGSSEWMSCLMCEAWAVDLPGPPAAPLSHPENQIRSSYKVPPS